MRTKILNTQTSWQNMLLDLAKIAKDENLKLKTVLHVGAHVAEEQEIYSAMDVEQVTWIEANPNLAQKLESKFANSKQHSIHNYFLGNTTGNSVSFNITNNLQSSSGYALKDHKTFYPDIDVIEQIELITQRADDLIKENALPLQQYDLIVLDIQGGELNALEGMPNLINSSHAIYTEVNILELYKNSPTLKDIDEHLSKFRFKRTHMFLHRHGWGDAFYQRMAQNETPQNYKSEYSKLNRKYSFNLWKRKIRNLVR